MALRDKLRKAAAPYLEPGEQVQAVFLAKRPTMQYNDRAVVATDRRILLLKLGHMVSHVKGVAGEVPRETKLGPCSGFMHPMTAFGTDLEVNRRFFKDVEEADRGADTFVRSYPSGAMTRGDGSGSTAAGLQRVSPEAGLYADPGGQAGVRYWDGREWSPLLPADLASDGQAPKFPAQMLLPLPGPDGSWQYAASQARRQRLWLAVFAAAAVLTVAAALAENLWWLIFAGAFALRAFKAWSARKRFMKLDQAARAGPLAATGQYRQDTSEIAD
jgi:hypothetical protein